MIDVTLTFNNISFGSLLSTYSVRHIVEVDRIVTTMDGAEHVTTRKRPEITFSLIPLTEAQVATVYRELSAIIGNVQYTDPNMGTTQSARMRVTSNLDAVFGIKSITGDRYYKGGTIVLRQLSVLR